MKGSIIIVSGFSGAGKGTVVKELLDLYPNEFALSISATTRSPREGEEHGKSYFFISKEEFLSMIEQKQLLEYTTYVDNYYGTPKKYIDEQIELGKNILLEIEIVGAMNIKKMYPEAKLVFVTTKDARTLYERLKGRGTETDEVIRKRMSRAVEESNGVENYDYLIINDTVKETAELIYELNHNEQTDKKDLNEAYFASSQIDFINNIREELALFSKGDLK